MNAPTWELGPGRTGLVSVVIPTYQRAGPLVDALDSVARSGYRPIEIVVVDDGSTDGTPEVVAAWKARSEVPGELEVRSVRQANSGAPVARNRGVLESRGEFIQFLDSDDLLLPGKLSEAMAVFRERPRLDLVHSPWIVQDGDRETILQGPDLGPSCTVSTVVQRYLCTPAALYRRSLLQEAGPWNERLRCSQDREYGARVVAHAAQAARTEAPGIVYRLFHASNSLVAQAARSDPDFVRSAMEANATMRQLVLAEQAPDAEEALRVLALRDLRNAFEALKAGAPGLAREVLSDPQVRDRLRGAERRRALLLALASRIPPGIFTWLVRIFRQWR